MWNMTKMQAQALDAALMEEAAEKQRSERQRAKEKEQAKAKADDEAKQTEIALAIAAWEEAGLLWLKEGEAVLGPGFDFQSELRRLARIYAESRRLPYEDLNDLGVNVYAGIRAVFLHGFVALVLSVLALATGVPVWFCGIASASYLIWRFRARRAWLIEQRAAAHAFRSEVFAPRS